MTGFHGRSHIKLDPKGRLSFPAQFRQPVGRDRRLVVTNAIYQNLPFLDVYAYSEWQKIIRRVGRLPALKSEVQAFQRIYLSSGEICELDQQNRILLPPHFREYAQLGEGIVLIGMGSKIEIWSDKNWNQIFGDLLKNFEKYQNSIADLITKGKAE